MLYCNQSTPLEIYCTFRDLIITFFSFGRHQCNNMLVIVMAASLPSFGLPSSVQILPSMTHLAHFTCNRYGGMIGRSFSIEEDGELVVAGAICKATIWSRIRVKEALNTGSCQASINSSPT